VVGERADEVLVSGKLAGRLSIVVLDFAEGLWCFRDEVGSEGWEELQPLKPLGESERFS